MALDHILLGILREPASGYELKARFDQVFRHFWAAELSQIYRTLKRLERKKELVSRLEASTRGPVRRVYRTTASGRQTLRRWLAAPRHDDERLTYLSQVFFLGEFRNPQTTARFLTELRKDCVAQLGALRAAKAAWRKSDPRYPLALPDEDFHAHLALAFGLRKLAANVAWIDEAIAQLDTRISERSR